MTGLFRRQWPEGQCYLEFHYTVLRLWEQPAASLLAAGLGFLPLAPLAHIEEGQLPAVVRRMAERLGQEADASEAENLWTATYVLLGLRYPPNFVRQLLREVRTVEESTTFQEIITQGRVREAQAILLRIGGKRLGRPDEDQQTAVRGITDLDHLERLIERMTMGQVASWAELLATPRPRRRRGRSSNS